MADACLAAPLDLLPPPLTADQALFLDFDGTLVELAAAPDLVVVQPGLPALLTALAERHGGALAIVSGRPVAALERFLDPFAGLLIGQHGFESRGTDGRVSQGSMPPALAPIRQMLTDFATRHPGLRLEDKGGTLSLHFRAAPALADACRRLARRATIASCGRFRVIAGHDVIELVPQSTGKERAIAACLAAPPFQGRMPVFLGDDTGDEPGLALVDRQGGIAIRVGGGASAARYRIDTPAEVRAWLAESLTRR
jgi:trehalose 6-phosphate phosphatase